jgi:poly-gamma-glutamate synthase PgsB/CapB
MVVVFLLLVVLIVYGAWEFRSHLRNVSAVPVRIHVNGTRGKSSITRLIAGGLRGGGIRTFAKTTGTSPCFIHTNGRQAPIFRVGKANIIEQLRVFRRAVAEGAEAIVVECMAVQPVLQAISEEKLVRSTISVISNVRADHLEEMGPSVEDVARSLAGTIPSGGILFTAEKDFLPVLEAEARTRGARVVQVREEDVPEEALAGFRYLEHRENVALALAVCSHRGVPPTEALSGMQAAEPDPGVLRIYRLEPRGKEVLFVNAFAANDPDSTLKIWERLRLRETRGWSRVILANCREDRQFRSAQLGEMIARQLPAEWYVLAGQQTHITRERALHLGLRPEKIVDLGSREAYAVYTKVIEMAPPRSVVVGVGNIVGFGNTLAGFFKASGVEVAYGDYLRSIDWSGARG